MAYPQQAQPLKSKSFGPYSITLLGYDPVLSPSSTHSHDSNVNDDGTDGGTSDALQSYLTIIDHQAVTLNHHNT
jgi:hypothetical protein